jgi:hypothetical protein
MRRKVRQLDRIFEYVPQIMNIPIAKPRGAHAIADYDLTK